MPRYDIWFEKNYKSLIGKPFLFIAEEKHGKHHHLCHTVEDLLKVSLFTVQRRLDEGWYACDMTEKQLESLKTTILDKKDGWKAFGLLVGRRGYEYENISWEAFDLYE